MKRVLILTGESPDASGGMEHVIRELADGLMGIGYAVDVFHRHNSAPPWISRPSSKWRAYSADALLSWYLGRCVAAAAGDDVVAVISNGPFGWRLPRLRPSIKKIHFYHGTYRGQAAALSQFVSRAGAFKLKWWDSMALERFSGRGKQIVCNSDQTREEVLKFFGYRGQTIWLPMDTSHFAPGDKAAARRKFGFADTDKIGIFVGSAQPTKGFPVIRSLIESVRDVKWAVALRGEVPEDVRRDSRVTVFEDASHDVLPGLYNAADFAVAPSRYEAFGYVVAEALACGTPVVASPGGASRLFLGEPPFDGFLVKRADSAGDYAAAIAAILARPEFYRRSVIELIRPKIENVMASGNWLRRFRETTGL